MSDRLLRSGAAVVAVAGVGVAGYLTWAHYADTSVICVAGGGCEKVQSSDYAEIFGIPVAVLGLAAYATILALLAWDAPIARLAAASLALFGVLFSAYLLVVQAFVIEALCIWCVVNDVLIAPALAVLTALRLRS
ncbi:MAG: vitamin K epoxide reductase family protein [Gaiellaceae bacterium]